MNREDGLAPLIETQRLRLRGFRAADLDAVAAMMARPEVVRHLGTAPQAREESWRRMLCAPGLWAMLGYGYWVIERRDDGGFVGQAGFADFKRAMSPSIEGLPEIGWILAPEAQGQGYAGEAVRAALDWIDRSLAPEQVVAIIAPENARSIRVAERSGFSVREEAVYKDEPILLFRRPRPA